MHWCAYLFLFVSDIAISPNSLAWVPTLFGLLAAGLRPTLANSSYTPGELAHQLKDSGAGMIFVHPALFPVVIKTFTLLGIPDDQARGRVLIMSYLDQDRADEKAAKIGPEWTRLSGLFGEGRLRSEELFVGDQVHETAILGYSSGK
jgi:4-coumarate--CoA ligase